MQRAVLPEGVGAQAAWVEAGTAALAICGAGSARMGPRRDRGRAEERTAQAAQKEGGVNETGNREQGLGTSTIPDAVRICSRCGALAEGEGCASCLAIDDEAERCAVWALAQGALTIRVEPVPNETPAQTLFRERAAAHFHRLRLARLNAGLPSQPGLQADEPRPGVFESWPAAARGLLRAALVALGVGVVVTAAVCW